MRNERQLFATDKELFDLMFSSKQRLTLGVLHDQAAQRRVFCSSKVTREDMADYLSGLPFDFGAVENLVRQSEAGTRGERTASFVIKHPLEKDAVNAVLLEYANDLKGDDSMNTPPSGAKVVIANLEYSEFDLSRTRLLQRQQRDASFEFRFEDGEVNIRFPATDKGHEVVKNLVDRLEQKHKMVLPKDEIVISDLTVEQRSRFFLELLRQMDGYHTNTVKRLRVSVAGESAALDDPDDDEAESAEDEMLHLVEQVALKGENLLASREYADLRDRGFFITSVTWIATQTTSPFDRVQFDASFEDGRAGTGFRYVARIARRTKSDRYPRHFKVPEDYRNKALMASVEATARKVLASLRGSSS